jgi:hypothetical protein
MVRLVEIGVLEEDFSSEWSSLIPSFAIPKKNDSSKMRVVTDFRKYRTQLIVETSKSPISYSKDWGHDPFNRRVFLCFRIGIKYGLLSHQT